MLYYVYRDNMSIESGTEGEPGTYLQLFLYRIPKKNHDTMMHLQNQLADIFGKHGMVRSEFFQLTNAETFKDFTNIDKTISAGQDEEVWVELESYRDREHRDEVVAKIRQDPSAGPLFRRVIGLVAQEQSSIMGDFNRLKV